MGQSHHQIGKCADRRADEHQSADRIESAHFGTLIQKYADSVTGSALSVCRRKVDPETFLSGFRQSSVRVNGV